MSVHLYIFFTLLSYMTMTLSFCNDRHNKEYDDMYIAVQKRKFLQCTSIDTYSHLYNISVVKVAWLILLRIITTNN